MPALTVCLCLVPIEVPLTHLWPGMQHEADVSAILCGDHGGRYGSVASAVGSACKRES